MFPSAFSRCSPLAVFVLLICALFAACSKDPAQEAGESDANGYVCQTCNLKFYTTRKVFAEICPTCKVSSIRPVVGYVCDKDGYTTIAPKAHGQMLCQKCQGRVEAIRLPREADLRAWGATLKKKSEVSQK
jgi:hypothetical protein